jgi:uncharacterized protein (TIGR03000 family)
MKRRWFYYAVPVLLSVALFAQVEPSAKAGPTSSGGRSYPYRVGASSSASRTVVSSASVIASPALYSYYSPPEQNSAAAGGEEEQDLAAPSPAMIEVHVPANAHILVDGIRTTQSGSSRIFVTPALAPGKTFSYEMRVQWTAADGLVVDLTRTVHVKAGRETKVGFIWR